MKKEPLLTRRRFVGDEYNWFERWILRMAGLIINPGSTKDHWTVVLTDSDGKRHISQHDNVGVFNMIAYADNRHPGCKLQLTREA